MVRALINGLNDRNPVIKKQFSSCLSYLLPLSSKKEVNRTLDCIKQKLQGEKGKVIATSSTKATEQLLLDT